MTSIFGSGKSGKQEGPGGRSASRPAALPENALREGNVDSMRERGTRSLKRPFLLFLAFLLLYNLTLESPLTSDCMPNMYLPFSMLKHGSISLSFFQELYIAGRPYYLVPFREGLHSIFGIGTALFALPFFLPFAFGRSIPSFLTIIYVSKLAASFYVALSAAILYVALRRITEEKWAVLISLAYGIATPAFCTSSQALWQHAPSQFLLALTAYLLVRGKESRFFTALAGIPLGLSVLVRTTNLVFIPPLLLYVLWKRRSEAVAFLLCMLPAGAITAFYNQVAYGAFYRFPLMAPKYLLPASEFSKYNESGGFWQTNFFVGFFGNLISPSRGLFCISPILLLAAAGMFLLFKLRKECDADRSALLACFFLAFVAQLLLVSKKTDWTGGLSFGNRLLVDTLPFLVFLFVPLCAYFGKIQRKPTRRLLLCLAVILFLISVFFQLEGVFSYDRGSWDIWNQPEGSMWSIGKSQLLFYLQRPDIFIPPLVKHMSGEPVRIGSFEVDVSRGLPRLRFRLSELVFMRWYAIPPEGTERIPLFQLYGIKGENDLLITEEDLAGIPGGHDPDYLRDLIVTSASLEVEVTEPLSDIKKTYRLR